MLIRKESQNLIYFRLNIYSCLENISAMSFKFKIFNISLVTWNESVTLVMNIISCEVSEISVLSPNAKEYALNWFILSRKVTTISSEYHQCVDI